MKGNKTRSFFLLLLFVSLWHRPAQALIVINEILADPPSGLVGDANGDGVASISQDEFVELLNTGNNAVNLSGWFLNDALNPRHVFPAATIVPPYEFLVVFGGGTPSLSGINTQVASTGALSLNNAGDTVTLYEDAGTAVSQVIYGSEGAQDQSLVRFPEGVGSEFILHTSIEESQGKRFSPGTAINEQSRWQPATVPELSGLVYLTMGLGAIFRSRKRYLVAREK